MMTAHPINFSAANIATRSHRDLQFPGDPRSKRAEAGSKQHFDINAKTIETDILFQIVALENISVSKTAQLDELLSANDLESVGADRLKYSKQKTVNNVNLDNDNNNDNTIAGISNSLNYFKLTLQDSAGTLVYAIELEKLPFLSGKNQKSGFPIQLGSKLIIKRGSDVIDRVILLTRDKTEYLGGIVPEWNHKDLNKLHMEYLKAELEKIPKEEPNKRRKKA